MNRELVAREKEKNSKDLTRIKALGMFHEAKTSSKLARMFLVGERTEVIRRLSNNLKDLHNSKACGIFLSPDGISEHLTPPHRIFFSAGFKNLLETASRSILNISGALFLIYS